MTPQELRQDVDDALKALNDSKKEIANAIAWYEKMQMQYAKAILAAYPINHEQA